MLRRASSTPACASADAAHRSFVSNLTSMDVSHRAARANVGDTSRLRWHLRRCTAGAAKGGERGRLRVLGIGCSMTQGFMNCGGKVEGRQCGKACVKLRWATLLQEMLQSALPACDVEVLLQTSKGGRTVVAAARFDTRILRYRPHIVITDLTVCDLRGIASSLDEFRLQVGWESLLRKLLSVPADPSAPGEGSPAIVHIESWDRFPMRGCRNATSRIYQGISAFYRVPAVSFMLGVCAHDQRGDERHWTAGCSDGAMHCGARGAHLDTRGAQCEPHPGPHVHALFALLLAERIVHEAARGCAVAVKGARRFNKQGGGLGGLGGKLGSGGVGGKLGGGGGARPSVAAMLEPPFALPSDAPTLMPSAALAEMSGCRMHHGVSKPTLTYDFGAACGTPALPPVGWRCFEDRPGKLGWIADDDAPAAREEPLTFEAAASELTPGARLTVAYLRSYERMGRARLWLDDDVHLGVTLNGSWTAPTSQTDLAILSTSALCGPSCLALRGRGPQARHRIRLDRLRPPGGAPPKKFKLLLLELC